MDAFGADCHRDSRTGSKLERLSDVAGSLRQLVALLDWLGEAGADLVARDVGFDTRTAGRAADRGVAAGDRRVGARSGRAAVRVLRATPRRPARRIAELRDPGLSLNAIAAALNDEGIPTPRGGAEWRASSVQAALGYRRPPPPPPGRRRQPPKHKPPKTAATHGKPPKRPRP